MSLFAAIDVAVRLQLARDVPAVPIDYSKAMDQAPPAGYGLSLVSMDAFLQQVANRLRLDTPSLLYDWARSSTDKCLRARLDVLIGLIASDTTLASGGKP